MENQRVEQEFEAFLAMALACSGGSAPALARSSLRGNRADWLSFKVSATARAPAQNTPFAMLENQMRFPGGWVEHSPLLFPREEARSSCLMTTVYKCLKQGCGCAHRHSLMQQRCRSPADCRQGHSTQHQEPRFTVSLLAWQYEGFLTESISAGHSPTMVTCKWRLLENAGVSLGISRDLAMRLEAEWVNSPLAAIAYSSPWFSCSGSLWVTHQQSRTARPAAEQDSLSLG